MNRKWIKQIIFPLVAAVIWGSAFVFQSEGAEHIGPFTFNMVRCAMACLFLGLVLLIRDLWKKYNIRDCAKKSGEQKRDIKALLLGGVLCGSVLACASNLQQFALGSTSPGKTAFITSLYVVLVAVLGLFLGKRVRPIIWIGIVLAMVGMYFLCVTEELRIEKGDFAVLLCAACFACHIMVIDRVSSRVNGVELSFVQFLVVSLESAIGMLLTEVPTLEAIVACLWPLVYVGVFSGGIAYTLQILAQKGSNPTVVSLLLSLESVFAVLTAGLLTGEWMTRREWIGCVLMLIAVILAQLPDGIFLRKKKAIGTES